MKFIDIRTNLTKMNSLLTRFKISFVTKLSHILPQIRSGEEEKKELAQLISSLGNSPFSHRKMEKYLKGKEREIKQLTQYLKNMSKVSNIQFDFPDTHCDLSP